MQIFTSIFCMEGRTTMAASSSNSTSLLVWKPPSMLIASRDTFREYKSSERQSWTRLPFLLAPPAFPPLAFWFSWCEGRQHCRFSCCTSQDNPFPPQANGSCRCIILLDFPEARIKMNTKTRTSIPASQSCRNIHLCRLCHLALGSWFCPSLPQLRPCSTLKIYFSFNPHTSGYKTTP